MIESMTRHWGRAYALAVWTTGLGTLVQLILTWTFFAAEGQKDWAALASFSGAYMIMLGIVGGGSQLPNAAERLPGTRAYTGSYGSPSQQPVVSHTSKTTETESTTVGTPEMPPPSPDGALG